MKKRLCSVLLASMLAVPSVVPQYAMHVFAEEMAVDAAEDTAAPIYSHEEKFTVTNGTGAVLASEEEVAAAAQLESMTFEATFTATGSGVQSLLFIGDSTNNAHYTSIYLMNSTLGIECQDKKVSNGFPYRTSIATTGIDFTQEHHIAVTFEANSKIIFYLDGEKIHEAAVNKNFAKDVLTDVDYLGFGNGKRGTGNGYPMSGTISNIKLFDHARTAEQIKQDQFGNVETVVWAGDSVFNAAETLKTVTDTETIDSIKGMTEGSWSTRFRFDAEPTDTLIYLAGLSDGGQNRDFVGLYVMKKNGGWVAGIDAPDKNIGASVAIPSTINITDTAWHDLVAVRSGTNWTFYMDGTKLGEAASGGEGFFSTLTNPNALTTGFVKKQNTGVQHPLNGSIENVKIYSGKLNDAEARIVSAPLAKSGTLEADLTNAYKSELKTLFEVGYDGSSAYRIPALLTTDKGTVISFIDKRNDGFGDQGNIDFAIRRKEAGSAEFDEPIIVSDLLKNTTGGKSALMIDSVVLQDLDENSPHKGRIHVLVDMFTESQAAMNSGALQEGDQYIHIGDNAYRAVYKDGETAPYAVVEENGQGIVYTTVTTDGETALGEKTDYTVTLHTAAPYQQLGNLYKAGEYKGNIFMNETGPDKGELHMKKAMFIWHFTSDDDGKTWSEPKDITPQIKEDWMIFLGTGPGRGVQLENGRLVFPVYSAHRNMGASQSSAIITSDDYGETWTLKDSPNKVWGYDRETMTSGYLLTEAQPVQLKNGDVLLFMRNTKGKILYAVSHDNGESWSDIIETPVSAAYCQMSAITYTGKDGKEYVLTANPTAPNRDNGILTRALVKEDGTLEWDLENQKLIEPTGYAYSCLSEIAPAEDGTKRFGLFYELNNDPISLEYVEFDENYLSAPKAALETFTPVFNSVEAAVDGSTITVTATANQRLFAAGNVALNVKCGEEIVALPMTSESGSATVTFEGTLPEGFIGVVTLEGIDFENAELSNVNGLNVAVEKQQLADNSVIRPSAVIDYTSQFSDSTAEDTDGAAVNIIDGNERTYWHSHYNNSKVMPQQVTFDMGKEVTVDQLNFLNRQNNTNSMCKDFRLEASTDGENWTLVLDSAMQNTKAWQSVPFEKTTARYFRFWEDNNYSNALWATIAELNFNVALEGVDRSGDTSRLEAMIKEVETLKPGKTEASWTVFEAVINEAKALCEAGVAGQSTIDGMITTLRTESRKLVAADELTALIADYKKLSSDSFEAEGWAPFKAALDEAEAGVEELATQRAVDNTIMKLRYLHAQLVETGETPDPSDVVKTLLQFVYNTADSLKDKAAEYKADGFNAMNETKAEVKAVLDNENATQNEVDEASSSLNRKLLEMRLLPSEEKLIEYMESHK